MNQLSQLESNLAQIDAQREIVLDQIAELRQLESDAKLATYSHLIGKCFTRPRKEQSYKILKIVFIDRNIDLTVLVLSCEPDDICRYEIYHESDSTDEITLEQFETNMNQTLTNLLKSE